MIPPGRQYIPGYWQKVEGGNQWVPGYWAAVDSTQVQYLPEPPAEPGEWAGVAAAVARLDLGAGDVDLAE